ncbi:hypothetical protein TL16_g06761 [Triparma laevis f. inornata]|uniref:Uncharacterized protein n=1 Tax=Triparma laevis f. inornata TaxID=1714386 RepID=A0A9W7AQ68_9STRA|nr:hypothetical protein TL16_g06761 [Triparma laevis f. inornata]
MLDERLEGSAYETLRLCSTRFVPVLLLSFNPPNPPLSRTLLTLDSLLITLAHDPIAYTRAKQILQSKKDLTELLSNVTGVGEVIEEETYDDDDDEEDDNDNS